MIGVSGLRFMYFHLESLSIAKLSCFQKGAYCAGIKIFNSLPSSLKTISDKKDKFKLALKIPKYTTPFILLMNSYSLKST
jgi:hypothetical protein